MLREGNEKQFISGETMNRFRIFDGSQISELLDYFRA